MFITADAALGIARLNLELAIQQQQRAQNSDEYERLTTWVRHCEQAVKGWEECAAGDKNTFACGDTVAVKVSD